MIVVLLEDGFMVVFVPFIELKDAPVVMVTLVPLKNVELGRDV